MIDAKPQPPKTQGPNLISPADLKPGQKILAIAYRGDNGEWKTGKAQERAVKVNTVEPCAGSNRRTHTHVNRLGCYDNRIPVEVG